MHISLCTYGYFCTSVYNCLLEQVEQLVGHLCTPGWEVSTLLTVNIQARPSLWSYISEGQMPLPLGYLITVK